MQIYLTNKSSITLSKTKPIAKYDSLQLQTKKQVNQEEPVGFKHQPNSFLVYLFESFPPNVYPFKMYCFVSTMVASFAFSRPLKLLQLFLRNLLVMGDGVFRWSHSLPLSGVWLKNLKLITNGIKEIHFIVCIFHILQVGVVYPYYSQDQLDKKWPHVVQSERAVHNLFSWSTLYWSYAICHIKW